MIEAAQNKKDIVVFLDTIGRTIIAERTTESDVTLTVQNPTIVNITPQQVVDENGQPVVGADGQPVKRMGLQLFPLFFREFLADKEEPVKFKFNKSTITMSEGDITLDFKVAIQYEQLFANIGDVIPPQAPKPPQQAPEQKKDGNVIQLFDK